MTRELAEFYINRVILCANSEKLGVRTWLSVDNVGWVMYNPYVLLLC